MLEEIGAIQSRISEIQDRLAALRPPAQAPSVPADADVPSPASFARSLQQAQTPSAIPLPEAPSAVSAQARPPRSLSGITVTPASLGPLPALPVTPDTTHLIPLVHQASTQDYDSLIETNAREHGIDPSLVRAVIHTESGGNPRAVSPAGAMGLMQLMPDNVKEAGITDPFDPEQNIAAGTKQLSDLMKQYNGDLDLALAAYNAGPGNVHKYGGVPPFRETQDYIRKVRAAMQHGGA